ncbi:hypothetical protein F5878DRAFT_619328 [Lentinula raphanica]|uniref:Uncharacterized protein n=1 Tax=Lentinula raphanica TaxID=153919 RepID=A0AA38P9E6_9AGAR|nr:hypothetical protein F5878DRAFT_619328 [Lentinula raphanica]
MRILNPLRTPSMRLFAYLLLFFGCALNLFTAALPVTDAESKEIVTRSTTGLAPRAPAVDQTVQLTWTSPLVPSRAPTPVNNESAEKEINVVEDQETEEIQAGVLEPIVTRTLRRIFQFQRRRLDVQYLHGIQWRTDSETFFWLDGDILGAPRGYRYYGRIKGQNQERGDSPHVDRFTLFLYLAGEIPSGYSFPATQDYHHRKSFTVPRATLIYQEPTSEDFYRHVTDVETKDFQMRIAKGLDHLSSRSASSPLTVNEISFLGVPQEDKDYQTHFQVKGVVDRKTVNGMISYDGKSRRSYRYTLNLSYGSTRNPVTYKKEFSIKRTVVDNASHG